MNFSVSRIFPRLGVGSALFGAHAGNRFRIGGSTADSLAFLRRSVTCAGGLDTDSANRRKIFL